LKVQLKEGVLKKSIAIVPLALGTLLLSGCVVPPPAQEVTAKNSLTTGQVQLTLRKNETTQTQVLEAFGAPNLVTTNSDGEEVWTYQRAATVTNSTSSSSYGTIILFGGSTRSSGLEQSSRTMTLIIKFRDIGGVKRVSSFDSRSSSF
jgi:outer membrane protein assembly factor BamE (lipoprotein component of BamABCDE complex)